LFINPINNFAYSLIKPISIEFNEPNKTKKTNNFTKITWYFLWSCICALLAIFFLWVGAVMIFSGLLVSGILIYFMGVGALVGAYLFLKHSFVG
jgi:ABC-type bacteriocin/lantibiotic exporter with double-glycine peptidase domain